MSIHYSLSRSVVAVSKKVIRFYLLTDISDVLLPVTCVFESCDSLLCSYCIQCFGLVIYYLKLESHVATRLLAVAAGVSIPVRGGGSWDRLASGSGGRRACGPSGEEQGLQWCACYK